MCLVSREVDERVVTGTEGNGFEGDGGECAVTERLCLVIREVDETVVRGTEGNGLVGDGGRNAVKE